MQGNNEDTGSMRFKDRTKSLLIDSFKMGGSFFGHQGSTKTVHNLTIQDLKLVTKQQFLKQDRCQICFITFTKTTRQHHCRICANAVCTSCSLSSLNKQRACDVCAFKYSTPQRQLKKGQFLTTLKKIAKNFLSYRIDSQNQLKIIQNDIPPQNTIKQQQAQSQKKMAELNRKLLELKEKREAMEKQLQQIKAT